MEIRIVLALIAVAILLSAGIEDARTREIANRKSALLVLLAPLWWWANGASWWPGVPLQLAMAAGALVIFAIAFRFGAMGGGDVKLIVALTLWLPPMPLMTMFLLMSLAGGAVTVAMIVERYWQKAGETAGPVEVPYGVAIALAGILALNEPIVNQFG